MSCSECKHYGMEVGFELPPCFNCKEWSEFEQYVPCVWCDGSGVGLERIEARMGHYDSARAIAKRLEFACGLDVTPNAVEAIEEGLEAMRTERELRLASKNLVEAEKERDLEVWRQAYNASISCYGVTSAEAVELADNALEHYRAKREELMK